MPEVAVLVGVDCRDLGTGMLRVDDLMDKIPT